MRARYLPDNAGCATVHGNLLKRVSVFVVRDVTALWRTENLLDVLHDQVYRDVIVGSAWN